MNKQIRELYDKIDDAIGLLVDARLKHDTQKEGLALNQMETLMVETLQVLSLLIDKDNSQNNLVDIDKVCEWLEKNCRFKHPRKGTDVCMINLTALKDNARQWMK